MKIKLRTNTLISLVATILIIGLSFLFYDDFHHLNDLLDKRQIEKKSLFQEMLQMRSDPVLHLTMDYSFWDDMVRVVNKPDKDWFRENVDSSFSTYRHNALWIYNRNNQLVHSIYKNGDEEIRDEPFPVPLDKILPLIDELNQFPHFFALTPHGLMEIFGASLQSPRDGDRTGPSHGLLLAGVLWDERTLSNLAMATRSAITLREPAEHSQESLLDPRQGFLRFSLPLDDLNKAPLKTLDVRIEMPEIRHLILEKETNALIGASLIIVLIVLIIYAMASRQRLKIVNRNLDLAQQTAQLGSWQRDISRGTSYWSDNLYRIFGLPVKGVSPSLSTFLPLIHQDDRSRVRDIIEQSEREQIGYQTEFRLIRPDGKLRNMRSRGEVMFVGGSKALIVGSTQDITESSIIEKELALLVRHKDTFIARLGHDLKTPLTPLLVLLPLIRERTVDPDIDKMLCNCLRNVTCIQELTTKTLKLARLFSTAQPTALQTVNLAAMVEKVLEKNSAALDQREISSAISLDDGLFVQAVPDQLEELFDNIIANAVHFSAKKGTLRIGANCEAEMVTVSMRDEGIGLEAEDLERIFEEFYKVDESRHDVASPGLGLSICKRIAQNHGGAIWAESPGPGAGTTIYFTLRRTGE